MMQTPKRSVSKNSSSEVPKRTSPITPRSSRKINVTASESDSTSSACPGTNTPKNKSPKLAEHKSPRSPATEKKRPNRVMELETQITQLREDLKKARDQLASSESWKKQAEEEAEDAKKQSMATMAKLEEIQKKIKDLSDTEDARVQELVKIGQERDQAWQSELEAVQSQHSLDSAALSSAKEEMQRLRQQIEGLSNSEAPQPVQPQTADGELQLMKAEMEKTLLLINSLKCELEASAKSEEEYQILLNQTQVQLDIAKTLIETLKSDGLKVMETLSTTVAELKEYKARVHTLEDAARKAHTDDVYDPPAEHDVSLKTKLDSLNSEIKHLKLALEEAEVKYNEDQIKCIMQIQSTHEEAEHLKTQSGIRESTLEALVDEAKEEIAKLKECLVDREELVTNLKNKLNSVNEATQDKEKIENSIKEIADLREKLEGKEAMLNKVLDENEHLKSEMEKKETERIECHESAKADIEKARAAEQDALTKIGIATAEADDHSRKAARVTEQLEAAQAANTEMETELRRLRIQSDQWRKAAEAAAAILTSGNNGNLMERTTSFGPNNSLGGKLLNSPFSDEVDDESPKKKNNMLRKIGVLWKKGQK